MSQTNDSYMSWQMINVRGGRNDDSQLEEDSLHINDERQGSDLIHKMPNETIKNIMRVQEPEKVEEAGILQSFVMSGIQTVNNLFKKEDPLILIDDVEEEKAEQITETFQGRLESTLRLENYMSSKVSHYALAPIVLPEMEIKVIRQETKRIKKVVFNQDKSRFALIWKLTI